MPSRITANPFVPQLDGFDFGQSCPHGCWLGINPGVTTADEAKAILQTSNQIDKTQYLISDEGIYAVWKPENFKTTCEIRIQFENGLVQSLIVSNMEYTINDFVRVLGEPDLIRIKVQRAIVDSVAYSIYFSSKRVMIGVLFSGWTGPDPSDTNLMVWLNVEPDLSTPPVDWGDSQPWLGYGHIKDYLPGVVIPTQDATPNPSQGEIPIP